MSGPTRRAGLHVAGGAVLLTAVIVGTPLLGGRAYSQADNLFEAYPWRAHRPADFVRPGNTLLGDVPAIFYPNLAFAREAVGAGRFPVWNPRVYGGQPFVGAMQTAMFSPVTWLTLAIPLPDALAWMYVLRLLIGGAGMFVLLGAAGMGGPARVFGGLAWLLAPFSIVWLGHPLSEVAAWLPWMAWATWRTCRRGRAADLATLALFTALDLFAGHPETTMKALLLCGVLAVACAVEHKKGESVGRARFAARGPAAALARALAGVLLGVALAAVQVLPTLEYLRESRILADRDRGGANIYVAPPETAVTAVVPNFLGHPASNSYLPMENRYGLASNYAEQQAYAGIAVWLLAGIGAWHRRREPTTIALAASAALAAMLMYGAPGVSAAFTAVPGLDVIVLSRFGLVVTFCAAWLAAAGLDALVMSPATTRRWPAALVAAGMAGLVAASVLFLRRALLANGRFDEALGWAGWAALLAGVSLVAIAWRGSSRLSANAFALAITATLSADLSVFAWGFHPTVDRSWVFPAVPELLRVSRDAGLVRVIGWERALLPNTASVYGLSDVRGYDGIGPRAWGEMLDAGMTGGHWHQWRDLQAAPLLDLLGVRYALTPPAPTLPPGRFTRIAAGPAPLWRNDRALPRAFLASRYVVGRGPGALRAFLATTTTPGRTVLLEESPDDHSGPGNGTVAREQLLDPAGSAGTAAVRHYRDTFVQIVTIAPGPRILVLTDNHFPGWSASVDGRPAPIVRAYHALRAVVVPAGEHIVEFRYRPLSLVYGAGLSVAAGLLLLALCVRARFSAAVPRAVAASA